LKSDGTLAGNAGMKAGGLETANESVDERDLAATPRGEIQQVRDLGDVARELVEVDGVGRAHAEGGERVERDMCARGAQHGRNRASQRVERENGVVVDIADEEHRPRGD
jgi:hypothetical protein